MIIGRNTQRSVWLAVVAVAIGMETIWLAATPGPGTGRSFLTLQSPFTQDLYATSASVPHDGSILGGVAFAPDGRVWSAECAFLGTKLHRFASGTTSVNGSSVHGEELVVDLTSTPFGPAGGCGLVNHPDGAMYSNSMVGIWKLDATTGQPLGPAFGPAGNALGIAVDPQGPHHLVYIGDDCHPDLHPDSTVCTIWDVDPVSHAAMVFARLTRAEFAFVDGIYFDPTGNFLFMAHREEDFGPPVTESHALTVVRRPTALEADSAPVDDTQVAQSIAMVSEPDGVAFHAGDGFVVTVNESLDCKDTSTNKVVASDPNTGTCPATSTPIGGTITRFDFGNGYDHGPTAITAFATDGFRGDLTQVGADGCIYATQSPLHGGTLGMGDTMAGSNVVYLNSIDGLTVGTLVTGPGIPPNTRIASIDTFNWAIVLTENATDTNTVPVIFGAGARYDNLVETYDNSLVQICGGFVAPPGVSQSGSVTGTVFTDTNGNGIEDSGETGTPGVTVTVTGSDNTPHTTTTDSNGTFTVQDLPSGNTTVNVTPPPGTTVNLPGPVTVNPDQTTSVPPIAAVPLGRIAGIVYKDVNKNGVRDSGEPGIGSVTVLLSGNANGSTATAADGTYSFAALASGSYLVTSPATAAGLALETTSPLPVSLAAGENKADVNFGYVSTPDLTVSKQADVASVVAGNTAGFTVTIINQGQATATGVTLNDPLPGGAGHDVNWTIDAGTGNPSFFKITGAVGSQVLSLNANTNLAGGSSLTVHVTGATGVNDTGTSTNPALGAAGKYAVLYTGTGGHNFSISNVTIAGNIGVGGTGVVQFSGPGTIAGRLDFSATNTGQYHNTNGSNVGPTSVNYNAQAVTSALSAMTSLSSSLGALPGTHISFNNSNQTVNENAGTLQTVGGITYRVFAVTSYSETNANTVTIVGDGSGNPVVFNFGFNSDVNLGGQVVLAGSGLTEDLVMWNFTSSGKNVQLTNNGGTYRGVILVPNDKFSSSNTVLNGRIYGGDSSDFQIVSGANVYVPPTTGTLPNTATVSATNEPSGSQNNNSATATITITQVSFRPLEVKR